MTPEQRYYDVVDVAGLVGKSPLTIRRWIKAGKIPAPEHPLGWDRAQVRAIVDLVAKL